MEDIPGEILGSFSECSCAAEYNTVNLINTLNQRYFLVFLPFYCQITLYGTATYGDINQNRQISAKIDLKSNFPWIPMEKSFSRKY